MRAGPDWLEINQELVAKAIGELSFEQVLRPTRLKKGEPPFFQFVLSLNGQVSYSFQAWEGIWQHLRVLPRSIQRWMQGTSTEVSAGQFFIDTQNETKMSDIVLGNFLEEMNNTLYSDGRLYQKRKRYSVAEIATWCGDRIQSILAGHPKILLNKGRMGWGSADLEAYSPESEKRFRLFWVAASISSLQLKLSQNLSTHDLLKESLSEDEIKKLLSRAHALGVNPEEVAFFPIHPWQWDRIIQIQFFSEIQTKKLVPLGFYGDEYLPQISIRTLSNGVRPCCADIKLPLTLLNTSAVRGISSKYIPFTVPLSEAFSKLCQNDPLLREAKTEVLLEKAAVSYSHPFFHQVKGAPYRYHEQLAVIWRESLPSKERSPREKCVLTGSLFYQDSNHQSLVGTWIKRSGLTIPEWLRRYFQVVVVPLYHLQCRYGIGLVAHGQNIVLKLRDYVPFAMILKDFQGDLRISSTKISFLKTYFGDLTQNLDALPPGHLVHDLFTGHFVTVLRFVSETLQESDHFPEQSFYQILREVLHSTFSSLDFPDLFEEKMPRVVVNPVRFQIGYGDSTLRPKPFVAGELINPLHQPPHQSLCQLQESIK